MGNLFLKIIFLYIKYNIIYNYTLKRSVNDKQLSKIQTTLNLFRLCNCDAYDTYCAS